MNNEVKIKILEGEILKHKNLYYQGKPEISDVSFDALEDELKKLCPDSYVLSVVGATHFIDEKVQHDKKMLSLNKTYRLDELLSWSDGKEVLSTFKIDGSSCSLIYHEGAFVLGKTRGDGRYGENISKKILFINHIPKKLNIINAVEVRGEVYCTEENFYKLSTVMEKLGLDKPTSQRNIVAGLLGRKENIELCEYLSFQAFELIAPGLELKTEVEKFHKLQSLGFETPEFFLNKTKKDFDARMEEAKDFLSFGPYLIDGIVFSFNDLEIHNTMGETAHHPRYKLAFKFQGETKTTTIESISWQVSRNGILTPVANVSPIELSGATVARVTLHNFGMVRQYNLKVGDEIEIVRSGEVIPKFLAVVKESTNAFVFPQTCPSCSQEVFEEDIRLYCKNEFCPDKVKDDILNFIQKIGIDDLSTKRLEDLIKLGFVKDIPSLYELSRDQLLSMEKIKDKLADKILASIEKSKMASLINVLSSLGISGGAYNKCEKIVNHGYDSIDKILGLTPANLELIESFAEKSAADFISSLTSKKNIIEKLRGYGFQFNHEVATKIESKITGLKFCITGTLSQKRSDLQKLVKMNGGVVQAGVSKDTNYLITNDVESGSSKFKKAKELNIPIINEEAFFKLLN